jgi:hypothetical protein
VYAKIKYEHFSGGEIVFKHGKLFRLIFSYFTLGDFGSKFFIILKGSVSVQVPIKNNQSQLSDQLARSETGSP